MIFSEGTFESWVNNALSERTFKMKLSFEEKDGSRWIIAEFNFVSPSGTFSSLCIPKG